MINDIVNMYQKQVNVGLLLCLAHITAFEEHYTKRPTFMNGGLEDFEVRQDLRPEFIQANPNRSGWFSITKINKEWGNRHLKEKYQDQGITHQYGIAVDIKRHLIEHLDISVSENVANELLAAYANGYNITCDPEYIELLQKELEG